MRRSGANQKASAVQTMRRRIGIGFIARALSGRLLGLAAAFLLTITGPAIAQTVKGDVTVINKDGYVRLIVRLAEEVESTTKVAGGIIVVQFKRPVEVGIEKVANAAPDYVGAARRDPDGAGLRIALARKVTVNSMAAGERLFIDLLPDTWTGVAPGLPQDVIEDLAKRARDAEKLLRQQRLVNQKSMRAMRVRVATQPTFTRYVFELHDVIPVTTDRTKEALIVTFGVPMKFDLTDAKANLPPVLRSIEGFVDTDASSVRFALSSVADIRTFREDTNYIVDIGAADGKESNNDTQRDGLKDAAKTETPVSNGLNVRSPLAGLDAPETVPAKVAPGKPQAAASRAQAPQQAPQQQAQPQREQPAEAPAEKPAPQRAPEPPPAKKSAIEPPAPAPVAQQQPPQQQPQMKFAGAEPVQSEAQLAPAKAAAAQVPQSVPQSAPPPVAEKPAAPAKAAEAAPAEKPAEIPAAAAAAPRDPNSVKVEYARQGDNLSLAFPFTAPTPAAIFRRADTVWLVFDSTASIDLSALQSETSNTIRSAQLVSLPDGQVVRLKLERPRLASVSTEGTTWVVRLGDNIIEPTRPLGVARNVAGAARATVTIPFDQPRKLYRVADPEIGDTLLVVTALAPARGFLKGQDFVEFNVLASTQGIVLQPIADDVQADLSADKVVIARPTGLTLSGASAPIDRNNSAAFRPIVFDPQLWGFDKQSNFTERQYKLIAAAADAGEARRAVPRMELARFYLSRDMFPEAKGVLDIAIADERPTAENPTALVLRAISNIMLNRADEALKELNDPLVADQFDAPLWRAFAQARLGKWADARSGFKNVEASIATLPIELQQLALKEAMRAAIEVRDFSGAADKLHEFETIGMPRNMQPSILVLTGRLAHGLGKNEDALKAFRAAAETADRPAAAQGQLREIALRYGLGDLKRHEVINDLETLTALWRGDETEIEALQMLARLYTEENRYRDAFYVMRTALRAHPNSEMTRRIQEEAAVTFDSLFLAGKGDALPAIDALSLFYDFRELTPIGRRGDEMIRRLADRLVSVDLLYQASELLQHQIDNRLQGAARSQVATRLAVIYLMDRKPDKAVTVLKNTRMAELSTELRTLRLLLEARALSDMKRTDLALEVIANIDRREAIRLRSDILWAAKRYGESAEQMELLYGERWKDFEPLDPAERSDILRAAIGYALAEDAIGLGRLREKYTPKMTDAADRRAFEVATAPFGANATEFREVAKMVATSDTLGNFLREMRAGYPELGAMSGIEPATQKAAQKSAAAKGKSPDNKVADSMPTGSILSDQRKMKVAR
jgi:hypothetical protein